MITSRANIVNRPALCAQRLNWRRVPHCARLEPPRAPPGCRAPFATFPLPDKGKSTYHAFRLLMESSSDCPPPLPVPPTGIWFCDRHDLRSARNASILSGVPRATPKYSARTVHLLKTFFFCFLSGAIPVDFVRLATLCT